MTSPASSAGDVAIPRQSQAIWDREIPFRNPDFIGREEELEALHSFLGGKSSSTALIGHPIEAVHGLGGVGKTELAAEYAHRYRDEYDLVWWIRAEQDYAIGAGLIDLGTRLGLTDFQPNDRDYSIGVVIDALAGGEPVRNWLLIFDDAPSASALTGYIPRSQEYGHVIITSRNIHWRSLRIDGIDLAEFKLEETVEFLRTRVPVLKVVDVQAVAPDQRENAIAEEQKRLGAARELASELGNLPLAVEHASAYLKETGASIEEYLEAYRASPDEVLGREVDLAYMRPVATTWMLSMHTVLPEAVAIFNLLAFFAPEPVAEELIMQPAVAGLPDSIAEIVDDKSKLRPAVRELSKYSLVKIDGVRNVVQMHRVVQAVTRDRMKREDPAQAKELREAVHLLLAASDPCSPDRPDSAPIYDRSREHLLSSGAVGSEVPGVRQLVINQVRQLHRRGGYAESLSLGERALEGWRVKFPPDDKLTLTLAVEVGVAMRSAGRWEEAVRLDSETLGLLKQYYGDKDQVYLECGRSYGRDLSMLGRYDEALENDLRLLPVYEEERRADHEIR